MQYLKRQQSITFLRLDDIFWWSANLGSGIAS